VTRPAQLLRNVIWGYQKQDFELGSESQNGELKINCDVSRFEEDFVVNSASRALIENISQIFTSITRDNSVNPNHSSSNRLTNPL
jgi:hypothetical protein